MRFLRSQGGVEWEHQTGDFFAKPDYFEFLIHETEDVIVLRPQGLSDSADCTLEHSDIEAAMHAIRDYKSKCCSFRSGRRSLKFPHFFLCCKEWGIAGSPLGTYVGVRGLHQAWVLSVCWLSPPIGRLNMPECILIVDDRPHHTEVHSLVF